MARTKRKPWSTTVAEHGVEVRVHERKPGGVLYVAVKGERRQSASGKAYTEKEVRSLKHRDRELAERTARALAAEIAGRRLNGFTGTLTLGQLRAQYLLHRGPMLSARRQQTVETALRLLVRHLGAAFVVSDIGQHEVASYAAARSSGALRPEDYRSRERAQPGTIRNELQALSAACNWAVGFKVKGRPLLDRNPLRAVTLPIETNPKRPVVKPDRLQALRAVAADVDVTGQFGMMLEIAWVTGRRINAICHLRASDVLLTPDALRRAFAEDGQDEEIAREWPAGLRWRAEWDKKGFLTFSPIPAALSASLTAFMRDRGVIGDGWLFAHECPGRECAVMKARADYLLRKAERAAGLPRMARGGWHAMRRGWATLRKSLPVSDVMLAGGWRDPAALRTAYQQADSRTVMDVVNVAG